MDWFAFIAWQPIVIIFILMCFDFITGFAKGVKNGDVQSTKMREGLWHKAGFVGLVVLAIIWEVFVLWANTDAAIMKAGLIIPEFPVVSVVCFFIAIIELVSIVENLCVLNPHIASLPFIKQLKPHDDESPEVTVEINHEELASAIHKLTDKANGE